MSARHDLGIAGQGPRRVIDVVPIGGIQGVEPVASGLKRDAEMDGAGLAAGEAGDHQDRPIAAKDRTVGTMMNVGTTGRLVPPPAPLKEVWLGHLTVRRIRLRPTKQRVGTGHESSLGWRRGKAQR